MLHSPIVQHVSEDYAVFIFRVEYAKQQAGDKQNAVSWVVSSSPTEAMYPSETSMKSYRAI
jgi:hypothetical protein